MGAGRDMAAAALAAQLPAAASGGFAPEAPRPPSLVRSRSSEERPVLQGAAEAIAESLVSGTPLLDATAFGGGRSALLQLRDALLAENADSSEATAARCAALRSGFAQAMHDALGARPRAAPLLQPPPRPLKAGGAAGGEASEGGSAPRVRIEVRNTAARYSSGSVFTVGRAWECDVQASGDGTVSRLQAIIVSLAGGVLVVDGWSSAGTRVVRRSSGSLLPLSVPQRRAAFIVPHGERVVLMIGAKTSIALGPAAKDVGPMTIPVQVEAAAAAAAAMPPPQALPTAAAARAVGTAVAVVPAAAAGRLAAAAAAATCETGVSPAPAPVAAAVAQAPTSLCGNSAATGGTPPLEAANRAFPVGSKVITVGRAMMRVGEDMSSAPLVELPAGARCLVLELGIGPTGRRLKVQRLRHGQEEGWISCLGKSGNVLLATLPPDACDSQASQPPASPLSPRSPTPPRRAAASAAAAACEAPARQPHRKSTALTRCLAVVRAGVRLQQAVTAKDRLRWRCQAALRSRLLTSEQCAELETRLRTGGGPAADEVCDILDGLGVPAAPDEPCFLGTHHWTCTVCYTVQRTRGWKCPFRHRFCRSCMVKWTESSLLPTCPQEGCGYRLGEHDLEDLRVNRDRLEAFRGAHLEQGLVAMQEDAEGSQVTVFRCPGSGCGAAVALGLAEARRQYVCSCGASPACTGCGATPYHYHGKCVEVQPLRARWLAWLQGGREAYKGLEKRAGREATAQQKALREALERHADLEHDEEWKAANCRLCPKCGSAVQKTDNCTTIVCGQNTHGGNRQPGCGHRFSWKEARPYKLGTSEQPRPSLAVQHCLARRGAISGRGVRHLFTQCSLCGSGGRCILGPRFRCIHCPDFSCCSKCEQRLATEHEEGHVFEIMFEDELDWSKIGVPLPRGIRARIRRRVSHLPAPESDAMEDVPVVGAASSSSAGAAAGAGRKRRANDGAGLEGVLRGQKRGRYVLELPDGGGNRLVSAQTLQPLLTQKQAEQLLASGIAVANTATCKARPAAVGNRGGAASAAGAVV